MIVDCAVYEHGRRHMGTLDLRDARRACNGDSSFVWIGLYEPTPEEFDTIRVEFNLHELAVEDALKAHQRPKLEVYGDSLFVVLKTARYVPAGDDVEFGEVMLFIGADFVITVRHGEATPLAQVRRHIETRPELLCYGPGAVLHAIVDHVVDEYGPVVSALDDDVRAVEAEVFSDAGGSPAERVYKLKREVIQFHQGAAPLLEPLDRLARRHLPLVHQDIAEYFRDVHDHLLRVVDQVRSFNDLLTSVLDAHLAQVTVRQGEDMRKMSAWLAIAVVPALIAGIEGMNFDYMPELHPRYAYPVSLALIALVCYALYRAFRRSGWL